MKHNRWKIAFIVLLVAFVDTVSLLIWIDVEISHHLRRDRQTIIAPCPIPGVKAQPNSK